MMRLGQLLLLFMLTSCASSGVQQFLDPRTSATVNYSDTPVILYRDRSGRAAFARDFVNIGPIQVNQMGNERYFLWMGIWSTMESAPIKRTADGFELVTLYADGEPMLLMIAGSTASAVGASRPIYSKPVSSADEAFYEVSVDQIRIIGLAKEIRIQTSGEHQASYELWDRSKSATRGFREFMLARGF
jgi:hypothetical protein